MKKLLVIGSAVQDITVEIDLERLSRQLPNIGDLIRLGQGFQLKEGIYLTAKSGTNEFAIRMRIENLDQNEDGFLVLLPGEKYTLQGEILDVADLTGPPQNALPVHCESVTWGGGGVNAARFVRALCPSAQIVPITYSDIAMNKTLEVDVRNELNATNVKIATVFAKYSADRFLEIFLAVSSIDSALYRTSDPKFRRNLVFSRVHSSNQEIDNKIICRGGRLVDKSDDNTKIYGMLEKHINDVSVILFNSLKNAAFFDAAYELYKSSSKKLPKLVGVFAMTEGMKKVSGALIRDIRNRQDLPPLVFVFNEEEFYGFAKEFNSELENFMDTPDDVPNIVKFAKIATAIIRDITGERPKIYVTLGQRGSLGVYHDGRVIYVSGFSKPKATIFDTNACGDAYCGVIALLEGAKKNGYTDVGKSSATSSGDDGVKEMMYFMSVATAAAYSKATNRLGDVDAAEVQDLLSNFYLGVGILGTVFDLAKGQSIFIDESDRLLLPENASLMKVNPDLDILMRTG